MVANSPKARRKFLLLLHQTPFLNVELSYQEIIIFAQTKKDEFIKELCMVVPRDQFNIGICK
jgi:hypothetical protein